MENNNNITTKTANFASAVRTKNAIESNEFYKEYPELVSVPRSLRLDFSRFLDKPVFIASKSWTTAQAAFTSISYLDLPDDALVNEFAKVPFHNSALYRTRMCAYIQVMGTPLHQGTIIASAMPYPGIAPTKVDMNTYLQAPHVFLSANESTPVCLEVPFYSNTKLRRTNLSGTEQSPDMNFNFATIALVIVNPLVAPTSGSTTVSVSVHIEFKDSEFYVPKNEVILDSQSSETIDSSANLEEIDRRLEKIEKKVSVLSRLAMIKGCFSCICISKPVCDCLCKEGAECLTAQSAISSIFDSVASGAKTLTGDVIDSARQYVRKMTGFHNPNHPFIQERMISSPRNFVNNVDIPTYFEKLDPYADKTNALTTDAKFYTYEDEMLVANIIQKPQYLGTFSVTTSTTQGSLLWARPITPMQELMTTTQMTFSTPLQKLHFMSRYWSGTIRLHIQAVMSNFHCCKLGVFRNYSTKYTLATNEPTFNNLVNLPSETLEFSGGGQVQTIDLPFCSQLEELPCVVSQEFNSVMHGQYFIRLAQPLVYNGSVSTTVNFNVYISAGEDFNFYGYGTELLKPTSGLTFTSRTPGISEKRRKEYLQKEREARLQQATKEGEVIADGAIRGYKAAVDAVSNLMSTEILVGQASTLVEPSQQGDLINTKPTISAVKNRKFQPIVSMRDHIRRFYTGPTYRLPDPATDTAAAQGLFIIPIRSILKNGYSTETRSAPGRIARMFYFGQSGGYKLKAMFSGCQGVGVRFYPPGLKESTAAFVGATAWDGSGVVYSNNSDVRGVVYPQNRYPWYGYSGYDDHSPAPLIECASSTSNDYIIHQNTETPALGTSVLSQFELEFEVPQMSPLEFTGTVYTVQIPDVTQYYGDDLGHIAVTYKCDFLNNTTFASRPIVTFLVSYADEARLGFNVFSPPVTLDYVVSSAVATYAGPYQPSASTIVTYDATTVSKTYFG